MQKYNSFFMSMCCPEVRKLIEEEEAAQAPEKPQHFTPSDLAQFYGTAGYVRMKPFTNVLTDGAYFVYENGAAWLITDTLVVLDMHPEVKGKPFVAITAAPTKDGGAVIRYTDGNGNTYYEQEYIASDLPCEVNLFATDGVLMLRSEY